MSETIEGLKFRVSGAWLQEHMRALATHYGLLLERLEDLLVARIEREALKPDAIARANARSAEFKSRARFWCELAKLVGPADRMLGSDDLSGMCFPIPETSNEELLRSVVGEPAGVEIPLFIFRSARREGSE